MQAFDCTQALPLIPLWADGELSEAQAGPLREHLLSCRDCRNGMQDLRAIGQWFVRPQGEAGLVPEGFSARVARRAFAGDTGERTSVAAVPAPAAPEANGRLLQFVLQVTSVAALFVIVLAIGLGGRDLPGGTHLQADDVGPTTQEILEELRELNASEDEDAREDAR